MNAIEERKEARQKNYAKYRVIADRKGSSDYQVSKEAGFSNVVFSDWKSGKSEPKADKLQKIASVLGVSIEELLAE